MDQQTVIRLRHVNVYHADDPFGSCSPRKLMQRGEYTGGRYAYVDAVSQLKTIVELLEND